MSKKRKQKKQKRRKIRAVRALPSKQLCRFPTPRVKFHPDLPTVDPSALTNNPIAGAIVELHRDLHLVSQRPLFSIWQEWLESTDVWLQVVGAVGEVQATVQLPPGVQAIYDRIHQTYSQISTRHPAAYRKMGETFTGIFRVLADHCRRVDLDTCGQHGITPDFLGLAFIASLDYPQKWHRFFPDWENCTRSAAAILPGDPAEQIYAALARGHAVATRLHSLKLQLPQAGDDDSWQSWLQTVLPYTNLPIMIDQVTSSAMLLALAARYPNWITDNGLVVFTWPKLEPDPVLNRISGITAKLYGLNGFYASKWAADFETIAQIQTAIEQTPDVPTLQLFSDHPASIYGRLSPGNSHTSPGEQSEQVSPDGTANISPSVQPSTSVSFADLFKMEE